MYLHTLDPRSVFRKRDVVSRTQKYETIVCLLSNEQTLRDFNRKTAARTQDRVDYA